MKILFSTLFLVLIFVFFSSCTGGKNCQELSSFYDSQFFFSLIRNNTDTILIGSGISGAIYHPDSITVLFDETMIEAARGSSIYLSEWIRPPGIIFNDTVRLDYNLILKTYDGVTHYDTFFLKYVPIMTDCVDEISYLEFVYNDNLIYNGKYIGSTPVPIDR